MKNNDKKYMFRVIALAAVLIILFGVIVLFCGCNRQLADMTYSFDRAIIKLPNGDIVEGEVQSWIDYEDSDQIQVKMSGKTYLVHSSNIVLINE